MVVSILDFMKRAQRLTISESFGFFDRVSSRCFCGTQPLSIRNRDWCISSAACCQSNPLRTQADPIGVMAKSVSDVAVVTKLLHTDEVRSDLPADGYSSILTKTFEDLKSWIPWSSRVALARERLCSQIQSAVQELVRRLSLTYVELYSSRNDAHQATRNNIQDASAHLEYLVPLPDLSKLDFPNGNLTGMQVVMCRFWCKTEAKWEY